MAHKDSALVVVDFQNDFCEPNGSLAVKGSLNLIPIINQLKDPQKHIYRVIILTCDVHPVDHVSFASNHTGGEPFTSIPASGVSDNKSLDLWPEHCVKGTKGAEFHPDLQVNKNDVIIPKGTVAEVETYSGFGSEGENTTMLQELQRHGIKSVDIVGLALDYCVKHTAEDAIKNGFIARIIEDGTAAVDDSDYSRHQIKSQLESIGVKFVSSSEVLKSS